MSKKKKIIYICRCFNVPESELIRAMDAGCTTLHQILDFTGAGSGPCGGTCRVKIDALLKQYLEKACNASTDNNHANGEKTPKEEGSTEK